MGRRSLHRPPGFDPGAVLGGMPFEPGWDLSKLGPLLWTRADRGIAGGTTGTLPVNLTTWTPSGAAATGAGPAYLLTATAGAGTHEIAGAPTTDVNGYEEITARVTFGTAPWVYFRCGSGPNAFFGSGGVLGSGGGTGYEHHRMNYLGSGVWECSLWCVHTAAGNTDRIGLSDTDAITSWTADGDETAAVQLVHGFDLGVPIAGAPATIQRRILDWADLRGLPAKYTQPAPAEQALLGRDALGRWFVEFAGAQHLLGPASLAAALGGAGPITVIAAVDGVRRGLTQQTLLALRNSAGGVDYHVTQLNYTSATIIAAHRHSDAGIQPVVFASTPNTQGIVVDRFSGTRNLRWGSAAGAGNQSAGSCAFNQMQLGRFGTGQYLIARVREIAVMGSDIGEAAGLHALAILGHREGYS